MEAVSFGAFQMVRFKGYKKDWKQYLKAVGLGTGKNSQRVDKEEKKSLIKNAVSLYEKLKRAGNVKT